MTETVDSEKFSLRGNGMILAILAGLVMMVTFVEIMLVPALPYIAREFPNDGQWVPWVVSAYLLTGAVATLLLGSLGDIYGKKRVMLIALTIYCIGLIGSALSWSIGSLIAFRAMQGISMGVITLAFGIILDTFPKRLVPIAIGIVSAMFSVGFSVGLLGGGLIVSQLNWRDAFYVVAPIIAILTLLAWRMVQSKYQIRQKKKVDIPGAVLISGGVLSLLIALTQGQEWGWTDAKTICLLIASVAFILVFIHWEKNGTKTPLVPMQLLAIRSIAGANMVALFADMSGYIMFQTLPFFLMTPSGVGGFNISDPFMVGVYIFPSALSQLIFATLAGEWSKKYGNEKILVSGLIIFCLGMLMLTFWHGSLVSIMVDVFVAGIGLGFIMVSLINVVAMSAPKKDFGVASGMNTLFRVVGGSIGLVLTSVVTASFLVPYPPDSPTPDFIPGEQAFTMVFAMTAILIIIGTVIALVMKPGHGLSYEDEVEILERDDA